MDLCRDIEDALDFGFPKTLCIQDLSSIFSKAFALTKGELELLNITTAPTGELERLLPKIEPTTFVLTC